MCRRTSADPLARLLIERYHVNVLPVPRADAHCADLYVKPPGGRTAIPGRLADFADGPLSLPPSTCGEQLADLSGTVSAQLDATLGLRLLRGFLTATGLLPGVVAEVAAGYERRGARSASVSLTEVTRDWIDAPSLAQALVGHRLADHPWAGRKSRFYVAAAVLRARALRLRFDDERSRAVELDGELSLVAGANAGVAAHREGSGETVYAGPLALAVAVELYELHYDRDRTCTAVGVVDAPVALQRMRDLPPEPAYPAGDEVLLELAD